MSMFGSSFNEFTGHRDFEHVEMHPEDELGFRSKHSKTIHVKHSGDAVKAKLDLILNTTPEQLRERMYENLRNMDD